MRKIVGSALVAFLVVDLAFIVWLFFRLGLQKPVEINRLSSKPMSLVYKIHYGEYYKVEKDIEEVESWAKTHDLNCDLTFGEYLDNPKNTEPERLRAHVGCIIANASRLCQTASQSNCIHLPKDFLFEHVEPMAVVQAQFHGSPAVGPWKVYPQVQKFVQRHQLALSGPTFEIYHVLSARAMETVYLFPLKTPNK